MQSAFRELYEYMLSHIDMEVEEILKNLRSEEITNQDQVDEIWGAKYTQDQKKVIVKKTARFMDALLNSIDLDGDDNLSEDEIDNFKNFFTFSSITSVKKPQIVGPDEVGGIKISMRTFNSWPEFEEEQRKKEDERVKFLGVCKQIHDLIINTLNSNRLSFEPRYGDGTFSFRVPTQMAKKTKTKKTKAKKTTVFANCGLIDLSKKNCYLNLYYESNDTLPPGAKYWSEKNKKQHKIGYKFETVEQFQEYRDSIEGLIIKSYNYLTEK